jgi:hypothetical protein
MDNTSTTEPVPFRRYPGIEQSQQTLNSVSELVAAHDSIIR